MSVREKLMNALQEVRESALEQLTLPEQEELLAVVLLETQDLLRSLEQEIDSLNERNFSLDAYFEIQRLLEGYRNLVKQIDAEEILAIVERLLIRLRWICSSACL